MCSTDYDPCAVWRETLVRRARKQHECYECRLPIPVGAPYVKTTAIQERGDRPDVYAVHTGCDALRTFIQRDICRAEAERDAKANRTFVRDPGTILMGGLSEEINNLNEYSIATLSERDDLLAMGFTFTLDDAGDFDDVDGPREVCEWLWDCVKAEYETRTA